LQISRQRIVCAPVSEKLFLKSLLSRPGDGIIEDMVGITGILPKLALAGAITALLAGAAFAQMQKPGSIYGAANQGQDPSPFAPTKQQLEERKANDAAYQAAMKRQPSAPKTAVDPWGDVRPTAPAGSKTKPQ
jgi:hypothetical protein